MDDDGEESKPRPRWPKRKLESRSFEKGPKRKIGSQPFASRAKAEKPKRSGKGSGNATRPLGASAPEDRPERVAKVIARAGVASRREAEKLIEAGRVTINGATLETPAFTVTARDKVAVDGRELGERADTRLWLYHKPKGLIVTERDPEGRPTIFSRLPEGMPRVVTIGRLDLNTEGLLLLTNDGGLARVLELPQTGWMRRYRVRAYGHTDLKRLDALKDGITIDGIVYGPIEVEVEREQGDNLWLTVALREGKNREVKRVLEHVGLKVNRLIRTSFGPFQLGDLAVGAVQEVKPRVLRDQLGAKLTRAAGAQITPPKREGRPHLRIVGEKDETGRTTDKDDGARRRR